MGCGATNPKQSKNNPIKFKQINYQTSNPSVEQLILLNDQISKTSNLNELNLNNCLIMDKGIDVLKSSISIVTLIKINLQNNGIGDPGAEVLGTIIKNNPHLRKLYLAKNLFTQKGKTSILENSTQAKFLQIFMFTSEEDDQETLKGTKYEIMDKLVNTKISNFTNLKKLDFAILNLSLQEILEVVEILEALQKINPRSYSLELLDLSGNNSLAQIIAPQLSRLMYITYELKLAECGLGSNQLMGTIVADCLMGSVIVKSLDLNRNQLDTNALNQILESTVWNTTLVSINYSDNMVEESFIGDFSQIAPYLKVFNSLHLSGNQIADAKILEDFKNIQTAITQESSPLLQEIMLSIRKNGIRPKLECCLKNMILNGMKVEDQIIIQLASQLHNCVNLQQINFSQNLITDKGFLIFSEAIFTNEIIKNQILQLNFQKNQISNEGLLGLIQTLRNNSINNCNEKVEIDLRDNQISSESNEDVASIYSKLPNFEIIFEFIEFLLFDEFKLLMVGMISENSNINISGTQLGNLRFAQLIFGILENKNSKITELNLSNIGIDDGIIGVLNHLLESKISQEMTTFTLSNNSIGDRCSIIFSSLPSSLQNINLSNIGISDSSIKDLKICLRSAKYLTTIDLRKNNLGDHSIIHLAEFIFELNSLSSILLSIEKLNDPNIIILAKEMENIDRNKGELQKFGKSYNFHKILTHEKNNKQINFKETIFTPSMITELGETISQQNLTEELNLSFCQLNSEMFLLLMESLKTSSIASIDVMHNEIVFNAEVGVALSKIVPKIPKLCRLIISFNEFDRNFIEIMKKQKTNKLEIIYFTAESSSDEYTIGELNNILYNTTTSLDVKEYWTDRILKKNKFLFERIYDFLYAILPFNSSIHSITLDPYPRKQIDWRMGLKFGEAMKEMKSLESLSLVMKNSCLIDLASVLAKIPIKYFNLSGGGSNCNYEAEPLVISVGASKTIMTCVLCHLNLQRFPSESFKGNTILNQLSLNSVTFLDNGLETLCEIIEYVKGLNSMNIYGTLPSLGKRFFTAIEKNTSLTCLTLDSTTLVDDSIAGEISIHISKHPKMASLMFSSENLTIAGLVKLLEKLPNSKSISTLSFRINFGKSPQWKEAIGYLSRMKLSYIAISKAGIGAQECQWMGQLLFPQLPVSANVDLSGNQLDDECVKCLSEGMGKAQHLGALNLSTNNITSEGVGYLLEALSQKKNLQELTSLMLMENQIDDLGIQALQSFQVNHSTLTMLYTHNQSKPIPKQICIIQNNEWQNDEDDDDFQEDDSIQLQDIKPNLLNTEKLIQVFQKDGILKMASCLKSNQKKELYFDYKDNFNLSEEIMKPLCYGLVHNTVAEKVSFKTCKLKDSVGINLGIVLAKNKTLRILNLQNNELEEASIDIMSRALKKNTSLRKLLLCRNKINSNACKSLAKMLAINQTLQKLKINENPIGDEGIIYLSEGLHKNTKLFNLIASQVNMTYIGANKLFESLSLHPSITKIEILDKIGLDYNFMQKEKINSYVEMMKKGKQIDIPFFDICNFLAQNQSLQFLHLRKCNLGDIEALKIKKGLLKNQTLQFLNLRSNSFNENGALQILEAFKVNQSVTSLKFEGIHFESEKAGEIIRDMLSCNKGLKELGLEKCGLDDQMMKILVEGLSHNSTVKEIDFDDNTKITDESIQHLLNLLLTKKPKLKFVHLNKTQVSSQMKKNIEKCFK